MNSTWFLLGGKEETLQAISNYDSILCVISMFCGLVSWKILRTNLLLRNSRAAVVLFISLRMQVCPKNPGFISPTILYDLGVGMVGIGGP